MQELNEELTVDEIFVPIPGSPSNCILGPCFKTTFPPSLSPFYPLAEGEKLPLHSAKPDWFEAKTLSSWPVTIQSWIDWVDRVEKAKGAVWKSAGIYDAIQLSKVDIPKDKNLLYAALCYWSISTNSFHFRFGMMGPTVLDIVALTGLRPHGEEVSGILGMAGSTCDFPRYRKFYEEGLPYSKCIDLFRGENAVSDKEHIFFLFMWLCDHLFCSCSATMIKQCTKLAFALAAGRKLALAPFLLSNLYHGCNEIIKGRFKNTRGPFWILQFWLQSYFPEFQPTTLDNSNAPTYGYPLAEGVLSCKSFGEYFLFFHQCSSRTATQFTPFSFGMFGPKWFKGSLDPYFQNLDSVELLDIWASYLIARDLPYSIDLDESSKSKCGVEHYSPNQFARQFGMTQAVPLHQSVYSISIRREEIQSGDHIEETGSRFFQLKMSFSVVSFDTNPSSTGFFDSWWSTYINTRDKTAIDVLGKISPHVMLVGPSEKREVDAPRSDGINGTSQTAGNFSQNTKRKCKGDSVPSQSLAEQEERSPKRHSNKVGEKISTGTLCQKMTAYTSKMPVPGTTSLIPSASAVPPSSAPTNEDRSKALMQDSADDTPISNPSSTSDKEGENCTVSPSLANTRSKTCEPPDCPVEFDNLEDFFACVSGQIERAQSLSFSADRSFSMHGKISDTKKPLPSAEMLATAKDDIERLLGMPSQDLLLPGNYSTLTEALSIYATAPELSVERVLALKKLVENLPYLSSTFRRAKKDQEKYYKKTTKKQLLIDELTKGQELYTNLKEYDNELECTIDSIRNQITKLTASLEDAETERKAVHDRKLSLAKNCLEKSTALDEMEAKLSGLEEMKELADSDIARVEASLRDFKNKANRLCKLALK